MKKINIKQLAVGSYHYTAYSFEYFLDSVKKLGINNIEIWGAKPHLCVDSHQLSFVKEIKKQIDDKGMNVVCFCPEQNTYPVDISAYDERIRKHSVEHLKKAITFAEELGASKMLLCPGNGYLDEPLEKVKERCINSVSELLKTAQDYQVTLVLETQAQEDSVFMNTVNQQKQLIEEINHPNLKAMLDTVQTAQFDNSIAENIEILGKDNVVHVHLGNTVVRSKNWYERRLPKEICLGQSVSGHIGFREGNLALKEDLYQLAQKDYSDYITIEICQRPYFFEAHRYTKEALEVTLTAINNFD